MLIDCVDIGGDARILLLRSPCYSGDYIQFAAQHFFSLSVVLFIVLLSAVAGHFSINYSIELHIYCVIHAYA